MKILNLATVLPYKGINEPDIVLEIGERVSDYKGYNALYYKPIPKSSFLLSKLNKKWETYYKAPIRYEYKGIIINALRGFSFPGAKFPLLSSKSYYYMNILKFNKLFKENDIDIIHAHYIFPDGYVASKLSQKYQVPYVLTIRNEEKYFQKKSTKNIAKKICNNAKKIISSSSVTANNMNRLVAKDINIIPHSIEEREIVDRTSSNNIPVITCVSNFIKRKNINILIKALSQIPKEKYIFQLIGDGDEKESLLELANRLNINYNYIGRISHESVLKMLKNSDIFVLVSDNETFGRVYIEAMAKANAIIALKGTGIFNMIEDNREAIFIDKPDVEQLKSALLTILDDAQLMESLKINAVNTIRKRFTWEVKVV